MRRRGSSHDSIPGHSAGVVRDTLFGGGLTIWQPTRGYRVNVDTLLLAAFAARGRARSRRVVDLGAGVGALGLAYAFLAQAGNIDFVEQDARLCDLATKNLAEAALSGAAVTADLCRDGLPRELFGRADLVLSNPPFFEHGSARSSRTNDAARRGPVAPFLEAAAAALGRRAAACFVYPSASLPEFLSSALAAHLVPKRLRLVHAYATSDARLALVELRRAKPGGLVVEPPLVEWLSRGVRSNELTALVSGSA